MRPIGAPCIPDSRNCPNAIIVLARARKNRYFLAAGVSAIHSWIFQYFVCPFN
jgi:hypothetical protein